MISNKKTLLFGRVAPSKGLEYLTTAFQDVLTRDQDCQLVVAGLPDRCPKYWAAIQETIRGEVESGRILVKAEFIPDEETEIYFKAADVPLPADAPRNRLTLARWIVDPQNPLTARVAVNHFWQMYFGMGLVKTSEDFGSQGDPPANQDLLDWMATEFVRTKWDVKAMQRLIVTSAVYRQSSKVSRNCWSEIRRTGCWHTGRDSVCRRR